MKSIKENEIMMIMMNNDDEHKNIINNNNNKNETISFQQTKIENISDKFGETSNWSSSIKPASRFSISTRRECKSTSDEPFTLELNTDSNNNFVNSCLISPVKNGHFFSTSNNNYINKQSSSTTITTTTTTTTVKKLLNEEWFLKNIKPKLNNGKFGFNPTLSNNYFSHNTPHLSSLYVNNASSNNSNGEKQLAQKLNFTQLISSKDNHHSHTNSNNHHKKKQVKRLSFHNNKIFINNNNTKRHLDYNHNKKLFHAVSNNDYTLVVNLLESNMFDVNCIDDKQRTCLHIASSRGYLDITKLLLQYGSNPNLRDCVNNLPIHLAIIASHVPVVTLLLEAGTDIHTLDLNGNTVLHLAGTRLRWLLNDENNKVSPKLKYEAIMIMNMIKEYLKRKKLEANTDLDILTNKLENMFNLDDISHITKDILDKFETDFKI